MEARDQERHRHELGAGGGAERAERRAPRARAQYLVQRGSHRDEPQRRGAGELKPEVQRPSRGEGHHGEDAHGHGLERVDRPSAR